MSRSNQESVKHRFRWIIDGITRENLESYWPSLISDSFTIDFNGYETEWKGMISQEAEGYLDVDIEKCKVLHDDFSFDFSLALNGVKTVSNSKVKSSEVKSCWGWSKFVTFDKLFDASSEYFRSDSKMELVYDIELFHQNIKEDTPPRNVLSKFFNETTLADFTLISSDGEPFKVHRVVLADASEYFMKLFTNDMKEKQQGSVEFDDIDSEALKEILGFIYNNETEIKTVDKATKVIYAAEKFNLPGLKEICCDTLKERLSTENAITVLSIAHMYNVKELENSSLKIIIGKYDAVKQTEGWRSLTLPLCIMITDASIADSKIPQTIFHSSLQPVRNETLDWQNVNFTPRIPSPTWSL